MPLNIEPYNQDMESNHSLLRFKKIFEAPLANDSTRCRTFRAERQFLTVLQIVNDSSKSNKKTASITHALCAVEFRICPVPYFVISATLNYYYLDTYWVLIHLFFETSCK